MTQSLPLFFPSLLVKYLCDCGHQQSKLLKDTRLSADDLVSPHTRVTLEQVRTLIENCERQSQHTRLSLCFGKSLTLQSLGMIGQAALSSETLGDALQTIVRYLRLRDPLQSYTIKRTADGITLHHSDTLEDPSLYRFISEAACAAQISFARQLCGGTVNGFEFTFDFPAASDIDQYEKNLGKLLTFNSGRFSISIPNALLQKPIATANPMTAAEARLFCERELEQYETSSGLSNVVKTLLKARINQPPTEKQASVILGYSDRNLRRHLAQESTSYRELLKTVRQKEAQRLLRSSSLTVEQIATELGYENMGNFCRAFKRWSDLTPTQYRNK